MTTAATARATVVVTSYQGERFLGAAVDSALAQQGVQASVVVVDDGSTDGSVELLRSYGSRIRLVCKTNNGQASAWNASLPHLSGEAVVFLDGDDLLAPDALARAVPVLRAGAVKVHGRLRVVDAKGRAAGPPVPRRELDDGDVAPRVRDLGPTVLGWPPTTGNIWCTEFLRRHLPIPEQELVVSPDVYLCSVAAASGRVSALAGFVGAWRWHGANASNSGDQQARVARECAVWEATFPAVAAALERRRMPVPHEERQRWYGFPFQLSRALRTLDAVLPPSAKVLLLDEDHWAAGPSLLGRERLHLGGRSYAGPPADAAQAHELLRRAHLAGADHIVTAWPASWWHSYYGLAAAGPVLHADDLVVVQRLEPAS